MVHYLSSISYILSLLCLAGEYFTPPIFFSQSSDVSLKVPMILSCLTIEHSVLYSLFIFTLYKRISPTLFFLPAWYSCGKFHFFVIYISSLIVRLSYNSVTRISSFIAKPVTISYFDFSYFYIECLKKYNKHNLKRDPACNIFG